jgi:hypothetical protein
LKSVSKVSHLAFHLPAGKKQMKQLNIKVVMQQLVGDIGKAFHLVSHLVFHLARQMKRNTLVVASRSVGAAMGRLFDFYLPVRYSFGSK